MTREMEKTTLFLSEDLLTQILIRSPVKSLLRFKCVSKSWLSLISDPKFARLHFELTPSHSQKLAFFRSDVSEIHLIRFNHDDASASTITKLNFNFPPFQPRDRIRILGSCHGFILLSDYSYSNLYLCNPITGFHKDLPSPRYSHSHEVSLPFLVGFGYDSATDDYLVTLVSVVLYGSDENNRVALFSLKANVWKVFEGSGLMYYPTREPDYEVGLFFNGALHWISYDFKRRVYLIVVFDLMERSFSEIALPSGSDSYIFNKSYELLIFGGFLSLFATGDGCFACDIWVMEEYKVDSSWTRLPAVVSPCTSPTKSGDIVAIDGFNRLVKFNVNGKVQAAGYMPMMYTESLLSLPRDS